MAAFPRSRGLSAWRRSVPPALSPPGFLPPEPAEEPPAADRWDLSDALSGRPELAHFDVVACTPSLLSVSLWVEPPASQRASRRLPEGPQGRQASFSANPLYLELRLSDIKF